MLNLSKEKLISFNEATKLFPHGRHGKRPHVATIYRWTQKGHNGVLLEYAQLPSRRVTSVEAVHRFIKALTKQNDPRRDGFRLETPAQQRRRQSRIEKAEQELNQKLNPTGQNDQRRRKTERR